MRYDIGSYALRCRHCAWNMSGDEWFVQRQYQAHVQRQHSDDTGPDGLPSDPPAAEPS